MNKSDLNDKNNLVDTGAQPSTSNPLLASIEEYLSTENLEVRLATSPLSGIDVSSLSLTARLDILDRIQEEFFEPMPSSVEIATRLFRLIRRGYINRDPTKPSVRRITMDLASYSGDELSALPWYATYAKGMTIVGVTGLGKSYDLKRALSLLPQRIDHGRNAAAGWAKMSQVAWLYVGMSHDGSMGGLLLQILCALDEVLGTNYSQDRAIIRLTNEKLAVQLGIIFRNHGVGVLVIDEIQSRNFDGVANGKFIATFFLRLLNFGIPVVLIGNPLGFDALYSFSQDVRRIGSGGSISLHPFEKQGFGWEKCMVPALCSLNLMPEPSRIVDAKNVYFQYSGGIRDYAFRVDIAAQRIALDLGDRFVTNEHLEQAFLGSDFSDRDRGIISGFHDRNPISLMQYEDMPWEEYATRWGLFLKNGVFTDLQKDADNSSDEFNEGTTKQSSPAQAIPVPQKMLSNVMRQRTRKENAKKKMASSKNSLESGDMRLDGLKEFLVSGLDTLLPDPGKQS